MSLRFVATVALTAVVERQIEVLALMMQGKSNKAICRVLDLAEPTGDCLKIGSWKIRDLSATSAMSIWR